MWVIKSLPEQRQNVAGEILLPTRGPPCAFAWQRRNIPLRPRIREFPPQSTPPERPSPDLNNAHAGYASARGSYIRIAMMQPLITNQICCGVSVKNHRTVHAHDSELPPESKVAESSLPAHEEAIPFPSMSMADNQLSAEAGRAVQNHSLAHSSTGADTICF